MIGKGRRSRFSVRASVFRLRASGPGSQCSQVSSDIRCSPNVSHGGTIGVVLQTRGRQHTGSEAWWCKGWTRMRAEEGRSLGCRVIFEA